MKKEKELIKNTTILTIGKVCTQMITFFLLPLYTAILSTSDYGIVDLLNTLVSLALPVITLQIEQAMFRKLIDYRNNDEKDRKIEYISTTFFSIFVQSILFIIIFLFISHLINNQYKYFLLINVIAYIVSSVFQQIARGIGKNLEFAISGIISALFTILFNILFLVVFKFGAYGMLLSTFIGQICCLIYLMISLKVFKFIDIKRCKFNCYKEMLKYALPLIPNTISWWIFNASDRIIVSSVLGLDQNGILSVAHKFSSIIVFILNIYVLSWTESVSVNVKEYDFETFFNKVLNISMNIFSSLCLEIIICMPIAFPILVNANYIEAYNQIPILIISCTFMTFVSLIGAIYIANNNTKAVANTSIISALINLVVNLALIKYIGLYAASISTLIAYVVMSIYRYYDVTKNYIKIKLDKNKLVVVLFTIILASIIYYINNKITNIVGFVIGTCFCLYLNKNNIKYIFNILKGGKN